MPQGFIELLVVILLAIFYFDFDRVVYIESLATLGIGGYIHRRLYRFVGTSGVCGSTISTAF
jgi:hypothetical protein